MLADAYCTGHGVEKNPHKAFELYLQAFREEVTEAMIAVSRGYRNGIGVEKNDQEADFWSTCETKTKQRNLSALQAGMEDVRNYLLGSKWFTQTLQNSAKAGKPDDMVFLAELHLEGKGVPYNPKKAVALLQQAADLQNADAMYRLGVCYEHGTGVPQALVEAYTWFRKAASYGHEDALRALSGPPPQMP